MGVFSLKTLGLTEVTNKSYYRTNCTHSYEGAAGTDPVKLIVVRCTVETEGATSADTNKGTTTSETILDLVGADRLIANAGVDTYDYNAITDGNDTITGFTVGNDGDKLDLSDLPTGETSSNLTNYLQGLGSNGAADGGDITVQIDADGGDDFANADRTTTLAGAGLTGTETALPSAGLLV